MKFSAKPLFAVSILLAQVFTPSVVRADDPQPILDLELRITRLFLHEESPYPNCPTGIVPIKDTGPLFEMLNLGRGVNFSKIKVRFASTGKATFNLTDKVRSDLPGNWAGTRAEFQVKEEDGSYQIEGLYEQRVVVYGDQEVRVPAEVGPQLAEKKFVGFLQQAWKETTKLPLRTRTSTVRPITVPSNHYLVKKCSGDSKQQEYLVFELTKTRKR